MATDEEQDKESKRRDAKIAEVALRMSNPRILLGVIASEAKQSLFAIEGQSENSDCFASLAMTRAEAVLPKSPVQGDQ